MKPVEISLLASCYLYTWCKTLSETWFFEAFFVKERHSISTNFEPLFWIRDKYYHDKQTIPPINVWHSQISGHRHQSIWVRPSLWSWTKLVQLCEKRWSQNDCWRNGLTGSQPSEPATRTSVTECSPICKEAGRWNMETGGGAGLKTSSVSAYFWTGSRRANQSRFLIVAQDYSVYCVSVSNRVNLKDIGWLGLFAYFRLTSLACDSKFEG